MYGDIETDASRRCLDIIAGRLEIDFCLIGGWAVHYLVNERYHALMGREYLGSRDIDLGFPSPDGITKMEVLLIDELGFIPRSFRYVKQLHFETGEELSDEAARKLPLPMIFPLYVDVLLPSSGEKVRGKLGFVPPDEPLLDRVFGEKRCSTTVGIGTNEVKVPTPDILMAMKLNSVVNRFEDHKRVKDLCDLTSLALFTDQNRVDLVESVVGASDERRLKKLSGALSIEDVQRAGDILGIDMLTVRGVISDFGWSP